MNYPQKGTKMKKNRQILSLAISFCFILLFSQILGTYKISAGEVIKNTLNIAEAEKNESGSGYDWANRYDILTLNGLNIDTNDNFGLRLPADCTVILEGKNSIKAAKYGISCSGTVIFKGNGSLTVEAGDIGFYLISQDNTQKIRILDGKYEITAGTYGIYSDASDFSFVDGSMNIKTSDENGAAILGRCVNLLGGSFSSNSPVETTHALLVSGITIDINASKSALLSKNLTIKDISLSSDGENIKEYSGEASIIGKSTAKKTRSSIVFGENVPGYVDYILLTLLVLAVFGGIFGPTFRRKKKAQKLYEHLKKEGYTDFKNN